MIETIEIKDVATYNNIGTVITNLQKINFVYGANGSGKTTVSNFISNPLDSKYQSCNLSWKGNQSLETIIYNKEFKNKNFNSTNTFKGIFTLGKATDDDIRIINEKKEELQIIQEHGRGFKTKLDELQGTNEVQGEIQRLDEEFKELCWKNIYKTHESHFKEAFVGSLQKQSFKDRLLTNFNSNQSNLLDITKLKEKAQIIFGEIPQTIELISNIDFFQLNQIEDETIWSKKLLENLILISHN